MALNLGLSASDLGWFESWLTTSHQMRVMAQITDLNRVPLVDVSSFRKDGQVNVDATQPTSRSATLDIFDPTHTIGFDTANPTDGAVAPKYALRILRGIKVTPLDTWIDVPVFWGPITKPSRNGDVLTIEAQGFEARAQRLAWEPFTVPKGTNKALAIQKIMASRAGEAFFRIAATDATLGADVAVTREDSPWSIAKGVADGLGWNMFYDAEGYLVARPPSTAPVWTFRTGTGGSIESAAQLGYEDDDVTNLAFVTGGTPSGKTAPLTAYAVAPAAHPLSPQNLGTAVYPDYRRSDTSDDTLTKQADVQTAADKALVQILLSSLSATFDSLPVLHLEEGDTVTVVDNVSGFTFPITMRTWPVPLNCDGVQSNGVLKRQSRTTRAISRSIR